MTEITNYAPGPRGINLKDGSTLWVNPGETVDYEADQVQGKLPDFGKPVDEDERVAANLADALAQIADLKAKLAKQKPAGLTGKSKDQLLQIATDEGVSVAKAADGSDVALTDATSQQLVDAITANRVPDPAA